ncbi:MAG: hypothetical protein ACYC2I_01110 [Elusimicrobiales bacterium]
MNEEKEKELLSLVAVRRPDAFWARQRAEILSAAKSGPARAWLLAPAAAAVLLVVLLANPKQEAPPPEAAVSTAFLDHMDMLDDMDVLEAVPEEEL